jgi:hypothetical protein
MTSPPFGNPTEAKANTPPALSSTSSPAASPLSDGCCRPTSASVPPPDQLFHNSDTRLERLGVSVGASCCKEVAALVPFP